MKDDSLRAAVSRSEVIRAARSGPHRIVGVTAPAGYGKSTLLAQWSDLDRRAVGQVSLDPTDDDPDAFVTALDTAFAVAAGHPVATSPTVRGLAESMAGSARPFVLLVDDLHLLRSGACHEVLRRVAAAVPSGSQLVTASRHEQPHLPRLRAGGDVVDLTTRQLSFGPDEARRVFARAGVDVARDDVARLADLTEGWPAGLTLAALAAREGRSPAAVAGDDRAVADYFQAEVLAALPAAQREFLVRSAVLEELGAEVCDAVLGRSDAATLLRELESTTLFLTPVGSGRRSYRLHRLFREFLLGELRREDPALVEALHRRAASWYEQAGAPLIAVEHLLATGATRRTATLLETAAPLAWRDGQVATVQRWLTSLGDPAIEAHARVAVIQGWVAVMTGQPTVAARWLAFLDSAADTSGDDELPIVCAMLRSAMCPDGPEHALEDARFVVEEEARWSERRPQALALCGEAHLMLGETDDAVVCLERATSDADHRGQDDVIVGCRATLAWVLMDRGQWEAGADHVRGALRAVEVSRLQDQPCDLLAHCASARMHLHRGDRAAAGRALADAMRTRAVCTYVRPFPAAKGRLELAKLLWATGDHAGTREVLRELHDIFRDRPRLGVLRAELDGFVEMLERGAVGDEESVTAPLTPAELRVLPYLQTHLTIAQIGERLFVSRNTANSEIASIYRKLGVSSRDGAVTKATVLGLLGQ